VADCVKIVAMNKGVLSVKNALTGVIILGVLIVGGVYAFKNNELKNNAKIVPAGTEPLQDKSFVKNEKEKEDLLSEKIQLKKDCSLPAKKGFMVIPGRVIFPKGIKNQEDYKIMNPTDIIHPLNMDRDGFFCFYLRDRSGYSSVRAYTPDNTGMPLDTSVKGHVESIVVDVRTSVVDLITERAGPDKKNPDNLSDAVKKPYSMSREELTKLVSADYAVNELIEAINNAESIPRYLDKNKKLFSFYKKALDSVNSELKKRGAF